MRLSVSWRGFVCIRSFGGLDRFSWRRTYCSCLLTAKLPYGDGNWRIRTGLVCICM
uniref:Uncharacterized protein n=1 Tax=Arundo donax TaxID=35708 RepID=A0A0A9F6K2_ARUDO